MKLLAWSAALVAAATAPMANAQPASTDPPMTELQRHLEAATRNAGDDLLLFETWRRYYCMYPENNQALRQAVRDDGVPVPLTQIFDDVWYVGTRYIGNYIFRSNAGFMLLDTMFGPADMTGLTIPALQSLGLGPSRPLAGVYLTHGHGDHDGGAAYLQQTFGMPILLGSADAAGKPYTPTFINSANLAPQPYTFVGRDLTLLSTPGHTPGSLTAVIPVRDHGKAVNVVVVGGSAMPTVIAGARSYLDGVERTYTLARQMGAAGSLHPHPAFDGSARNFIDINANGRTNPSQFVIGKARTLRALAILRSCSAANVGMVDATARTPVWRVTSLKFIEGSPSPNKILARVTSAWGPVANQQVTFSLEGTRRTCVANTDQQGVARCDMRGHLRPNHDRITALFAGATSPGFVDLPSTKTATVAANDREHGWRDDDNRRNDDRGRGDDD
jgi:glyoxylase-like metal-dependent hydrolase (beta-lactamase superfamily II)